MPSVSPRLSAMLHRIYTSICFLVLLVFSFYLFFPFSPSFISLSSPIHRLDSADPTRPVRDLRIAVIDNFDEAHDEVLGPLVYALRGVPGVSVTVFKDAFKAGFLDMFKPFFDGPYLPFDAFFHPLNDTATSIQNADAVFLPTAEFTLPVFMNDTYLQAFPTLRSVKIYAVVHRPSRNFWQRWSLSGDIPDRLATAISEQRLSFMTLAPHVTHALQDFFRLPRFANLTFGAPQIHPFIPVIPNVLRQHGQPPTASKSCNRAVLQGANRAEDFLRIQQDLLQEVRAFPQMWGYKLVNSSEEGETVRERYVPDATLSDSRFTLFALGRGDPSNPFKVLEPLEDVIKVFTDLPYDLFWPLIANCDVMLTGWPLPTSRYIRKFASSTIPTALMNRLPILLSKKEYRAYKYLDPPTVLEIRKNETEIQALARLRRTNSCKRGSTARWKRLEKRISTANRKTLEKILIRQHQTG